MIIVAEMLQPAEVKQTKVATESNAIFMGCQLLARLNSVMSNGTACKDLQTYRCIFQALQVGISLGVF